MIVYILKIYNYRPPLGVFQCHRNDLHQLFVRFRSDDESTIHRLHNELTVSHTSTFSLHLFPYTQFSETFISIARRHCVAATAIENSNLSTVMLSPPLGSVAEGRMHCLPVTDIS